jgi:hypothetical protein
MATGSCWRSRIVSFDPDAQEWVLDYTFTDHADHLHSTILATGY